jgi:hypothetical protein
MFGTAGGVGSMEGMPRSGQHNLRAGGAKDCEPPQKHSGLADSEND